MSCQTTRVAVAVRAINGVPDGITARISPTLAYNGRNVLLLHGDRPNVHKMQFLNPSSKHTYHFETQ